MSRTFRWGSVLAMGLLAGCIAPYGQGPEGPDADYEVVSPEVEPILEETDAEQAEPAALRVAVWNIQSIGSEGSSQYEAAVQILKRIDADIVALNEVSDDDTRAFGRLAEDLGYPNLIRGKDPKNFGSLHNAVMSRLELTSWAVETSSRISGDASARDVTRSPIRATFTLDNGIPVTVIVTHLKAGFGNTDVFRRVVEGYRLGQVASNVGQEFVFVMGDFNEDVEDVEERPNTYIVSAPDSYDPPLPFSYNLGSDVEQVLYTEGISSNPFQSVEDFGLTPVNARQLDGRSFTRPASGRRLDYIFIPEALDDRGVRSEVYDSEDDDGSGLCAEGEAPPPESSTQASDHFPVVLEIPYAKLEDF